MEKLKTVCEGDEAELLREWQARMECERMRLESRYGELSLEQVADFLEAEEELKECALCRGVCMKKTWKYRQPYVTSSPLRIMHGECEAGRARRLTKAAKKSGLPSRYRDKTFEDYAVDEHNRAAYVQAQCFVRGQTRKSLYWHGGCGTGKTFLATLTAKEFLGDSSVIFGEVPMLLEQLKASFEKGTTESILKKYCTCDLLVTDDLGAGQATDWAVGVINRIVNERYNAGKPVIVTSNYDLEGLRKRLSSKDAQTAERIVSRLGEMCMVAYLGKVDRRLV